MILLIESNYYCSGQGNAMDMASSCEGHVEVISRSFQIKFQLFVKQWIQLSGSASGRQRFTHGHIITLLLATFIVNYIILKYY